MTSRQQGRHRNDRARGQVIVVFALGLVALIGGAGLVVEGGNAYAQQRGAQNGADAAANAGAVVLAEKLGGAAKTDADVASAIGASAGLNGIDVNGYYTNLNGDPIDGSGNVTTASLAVRVGSGGSIPPNAQGVHVGGNRTFGTTFARVFGLNSITASADAIAIAGKLVGGAFLPVVFPVNITDCSGDGSLGLPKDRWPISDPGVPPNDPVGTEFIVPLCKTGSGSFMVLDLDGTRNNCDDEVRNPPPITWDTFPVEVSSDNGNNCAKAMSDAVNTLHGKTVLVPICDNNDCNTSGGSKATYHITGVVAFYVDYMDESNNKNNSNCQTHTNGSGQMLQTIVGNGSSSCIAGWFIDFITQGPVGPGTIGKGDAVGIQLIK